MNQLRIGTRGSRLALWQAQYVAGQLRALSGAPVAIVEIQTAGDEKRESPLVQIGGEGLFTKEIQRALLSGQVDVAVHSLKDLPTGPVEGLVLAAVPARGPTRDALVSRKHRSFDALPLGAHIASGSPRRRAQALYRRPDLHLEDIRGNVETRLRKLEEQDLDGLILAQAGLERLGVEMDGIELLDPDWMVPAVGQGALGVECRASDRKTLALVAPLDDPPTRQAVTAERALLRALGGGCQLPIGAAASVVGETLSLHAAVLSLDGSRRLEGRRAGASADAEAVGFQLAQELLAKGARELLALEE